MIDSTKRDIHRMAAEGLSHRAISRLVDVSHVTVAKVLASPPPPIPETPAHMAPPPHPPVTDAPADDAPALEQARYLMAEARAAIRIANASGDAQLAQRQTRNAAALMTVLARLEAADQEHGGFYVSTEEIARTEADLDARLKAAAERGGVRCSKCSRELSIAWATGLPEGEDGLP